MTTGHWLVVTIIPHHPTDIPLTPTKLSSSIAITSIQVAHVIVMMSLGTTTGHLVQVMMIVLMTVHGPVTPVRLLELSQYCGVAVVVEGLGVGQSGR